MLNTTKWRFGLDDAPFQIIYVIFRFQPLICEGVSIPAWKEDIFVKGENKAQAKSFPPKKCMCQTTMQT